MFMMMRLFLILVVCFLSCECMAANHFLLRGIHPGGFVKRMMTTQPFLMQPPPTVGIMGNDLRYKTLSSNHEEVEYLFGLVRASRSTIMRPSEGSNRYEGTFFETPVPLYQTTNKFYALYKSGSPIDIRHILPFGDEAGKIQRSFNEFQTYKFKNETYYDYMTSYVYELQCFKSAESNNISIWSDAVSAFVVHARQQSPHVEFVGNLSQVKESSFFSKRDLVHFGSLPRPIIPAITSIKSPKDILLIAKFYKDYCNFIGYHFCFTGERMPHLLDVHRRAFLTEPFRLLHLIRYDITNTNEYTEFDLVHRRVKRLLAYSAFASGTNHYDDLLRDLSQNSSEFRINKIKNSWKYDLPESNWLADNENLVEAALYFADMIWNRPFPKEIRAYESHAEFIADLVCVDPDFKAVMPNHFLTIQ